MEVKSQAMTTKLDGDTRHRIEVQALRTLDSVLQSLKADGRVTFWQRADNGYLIDTFIGTRPPRPKEVGIRIDAHVSDEGMIKVTVKNVFAARLVTEPEVSTEELEVHSLIVDSDGVREAAKQLLDVFVGPPASESE